VENWERLLGDLRTEFQLREDELSLLHYIDKELLREGRPDEALFSHIITRIGEMLNSSRTRILLKRGQYMEIAYSTREADIGGRVPAVDSVTSRCITKNQSINIGQLDPDAPTLATDGTEINRCSVLATPIRLHNKPIGVLSVESPAVDAFTPAHESVAGAVAAQVAIALQHVESSDVAALFADLDELLFAEQGDSQAVLRAALDRVIVELRRQNLPINGAQILFLRGPDELEIMHSTNPADVGITVKVAESICGRAMQKKSTIVVGDVSQERLYLRMLGQHIKSEIAVPIFVGGGRVPIGVLNAESEELDVFGGFNEIAMNTFADRVRTLLAFTKLRNDVTVSLELRSSNKLLAAVGDQASHMVHRLNNTVGAMRFRIKDLQESQAAGILTTGDLIESLGTLLNLADRTLDMPRRVSQLLNTGDGTANVNQCVRSALEQVEIPSDVALDLRLPEDVHALAPTNFDIVIQNLVQNALDAMHGGGTLTVTSKESLHPEQATKLVYVTVSDTGVGMSPEIQSRIFDLSFTTKVSSKKGMGLGLWWVRNFVRQAGGEVKVRSEVGEGTEFTIRMPVKTPSETKAG
jgi:signal transduction histidine kinase